MMKERSTSDNRHTGTRKFRRISWWIFILSISATGLPAQDSHYWTQQFGTRSSLMGGAVIGNVKDNSSIFYNPACLAFIDTSSISLNANLYQIDNTRIENALGQTKDFKNSNFKNLPLLFSGLVPTKNPKIKIGYGFASVIDYSFKGVGRLDKSYPIVNDLESPGPEAFIGQLSLNSQINETAFGVGIGNKLNDHWAIGATMLFSWRAQNYERNLFTRMFLNNAGNTLVSSSHTETFSYSNLRTQLKFGVVYKGNHYDIGLSVNTPSLKIMGSGLVAADITANNILYKGQRTDILANDRQQKIPSVYKTPWSVAAGINFDWKRSNLGFSAQYFAGLGVYDILRAQPATFFRPADAYPTIGSDDFLRVKTANKSIFNWSVGYEYILSSRVTLDASFRTNKSYYINTVNDLKGIRPDISNWDIYHLSIGGNVSARRISLSAGFLLGFGSNDQFQQRNNLDQPSENNLLQGDKAITKASYQSIGILLGFTVNFGHKGANTN